MTIAEALIYRKKLASEVERLYPLLEKSHLFERKVKRINVADGIDEVEITTPKITLTEFTAEYNHMAEELRKLDTAIQKANWETTLQGYSGPTPYQAVKKEE